MAIRFGATNKEDTEKKKNPVTEVQAAKPEGAKVEVKKEKTETASESTKTRLELLKPEFKDFYLYGVKILRERNPETNVINFYEGTKDRPIASIAVWIKNKLKDNERKKIEEGMKPYEKFFVDLKLNESEKQKRLKELKDRCFKMHEEGKSVEKLDEIPANINLVLRRISVSQYSVNAVAEKLTIPYAYVLPPYVSTIIITRDKPDSKEKNKIVCVRYGEQGKQHFLEVETGTPIFLMPNDEVEIAAITETQTAAVKAESVAADLKSSQSSSVSSGYTGGGGVYVGGEGAGAGLSSSSESTDKKTEKAEPEKSKMTNQDIESAKKGTKETNENYGTGDFNVKKLENREFNGGRPVYICTFPKTLDPSKKTRYILYFHGFGVSKEKAKDIFENKQATGGLEKYSKEKSENIVFVMPEGEKNEPKGANYFGETVSNQNKIDNLVNYTLSTAFEGKNAPSSDKVDKYLMGHSGANYAMEKALRNMPANYFKGVGLFDSLYSKGTGDKYAKLFNEKHNQTDVYSIYRQTGGPYENNTVLSSSMNSRTTGPKGHFETRPAGSDHSAMKYPGFSGALTYFSSQEKPEEKA